ncbi:DUF262 domain-containing protein [Thalassospira sp.]|uniref:DUF262 domain-containing protein n=1 Tax=Thalassospira sp. TaxID=1912094 RepID=UPI0025F370A6|nr:DUF262 domain-containing protein [Thalassospira sp.]|tara:strand:- start:579 stop:1778 length:1200 start_codon:yes stop_codon:yes gene_type:complete
MRPDPELDLFSDDDPNIEGVDDAVAAAGDLSNAVLYHTDWTVETLLVQLEKGRIDINPSFQRRDAWTRKAKSLLIESILLNFPVPAITLAERSKDKTFIVVDGKQRLSTLAQFFGKMPESKYNNFKITGLLQLSQLNGLGFSELREAHADLSAQLENFAIRTNVIRGWKNDEVLFSIFHRLNSASVKLSPQELRQSLHPGPFTAFISDYSERSNALRDIFPSPEPDFRMRDVELVTRYLSITMFLENYRGDLKRHLDESVECLNSRWNELEHSVYAALDRFEKSYQVSLLAFTREAVFRKWNGADWENRTNRAVFDVIMLNLLSDDALLAFEQRGDDVVSAFKSISDDSRFREAVERTTKTTSALYTRVSLFADALSGIGVEAIRLQYDETANKISMEV